MSNLTDMVDPDPDALTVKGRATRDRIITCATELILAGGFSRLSIESIRKAASVSGSQMSHYFPGRDTLTLRFGRRNTRTGPVPTYGALICEAISDQAAQELLADGYRQWHQLLAAGLQRMKDHADLVVGADTAQLASVLMSAHQGADAFNVAFRRPWPVREALEFGLNYLHMFAADPADRLTRPLPYAKRRSRRIRSSR
jgi:AcrR family transcriptional regulator